MAILDMDAKRAATISVPNALMLLVAPLSPEALGQLVRAAAGPKDKETDIIARITAAGAELARCQVSSRCLGSAQRCHSPPNSPCCLHNCAAGAWQRHWQGDQGSLAWHHCCAPCCARRSSTLQSRGCKCSI